MAGKPLDRSLRYAGWAVDLFDSDPKIDALMKGQGARGFVTYFYLCQRAYGSNGYFYPWSYGDAATTARKIGGGVSLEAVKQTVALCLQIGLFDKRLFAEYSVLTSRGIQKRYWQAMGGKVQKEINREIWLLTEDESPGLVQCGQNEVDGDDSEAQPPLYNNINYIINKTKENEKKEKEIKETKEKKTKKKTEESLEELVNQYTSNPEVREAFDAFIEMRVKKKVPPTPRALQMIFKDLDEHTEHIHAKDKYRIKCLNASTRNNWTDVYVLKEFVDEVPATVPVELTPEMDTLKIQVCEQTTIDELF